MPRWAEERKQCLLCMLAAARVRDCYIYSTTEGLCCCCIPVSDVHNTFISEMSGTLSPHSMRVGSVCVSSTQRDVTRHDRDDGPIRLPLLYKCLTKGLSDWIGPLMLVRKT